MSDKALCMWMRGGTSKGGYFLATDLPEAIEARDAFLLGAMGSPDMRQIDGMGGADPLTSKVAVVKPSTREGADIDYLFLQVAVDKVLVTDVQNCGNMLAGVGPFAIERGLIHAEDRETSVRIFMENTGQIAIARVQTPDGAVSYSGDARIDGVPGTSAPIAITFKDTAGSSCGSLLPTGNEVDLIEGIGVTCIDNGMPCVVLEANDVGIAGSETREELEVNTALREKLEAIRLIAGPMMNLGDVREKTVPKMTMVSRPAEGGAISTRTFIPHRCHASIGVLGAVSVATACMLEKSPAARLSSLPDGKVKELNIEHPIGHATIQLSLDNDNQVEAAAVLLTARKLFDGVIFSNTSMEVS